MIQLLYDDSLKLSLFKTLNTSVIKKSLKRSVPDNDNLPKPILKKVKFTKNPKLFNFIEHNGENSCSFDFITAIIYLLHKDFPTFIESGIESTLLHELSSIFSLLGNNKFDPAQTDMIALIIDNKFSPTAQGEFSSVSEIIEKMFINAHDSFYLRIEDCYWCSNNHCSIVTEKSI